MVFADNPTTSDNPAVVVVGGLDPLASLSQAPETHPARHEARHEGHRTPGGEVTR